MKYIDRPSLGLCRVDMFIEPTANPAYSNKVHWETNVRRTCRKNNLTEHKPASLYSTQPIRATELQNEAPSPIPTTTQPTLPEVPLLLRFWKAAAALPRDAGICKHEWPAVLIIGSLLYWTLALCVCRESCKPEYPPRAALPKVMRFHRPRWLETRTPVGRLRLQQPVDHQFAPNFSKAISQFQQIRRDHTLASNLAGSRRAHSQSAFNLRSYISRMTALQPTFVGLLCTNRR